MKSSLSFFAVLGMLAIAGNGSLFAANRLYINNQILQANTPNQEIIVLCDNDVPIYGVQMALKFDKAKISVTAVTVTGDAASAKWKEGNFDNNTGEVVYGFLTDFSNTIPYPFNLTLPAGAGHAVIKLTVTVKSTTNTSTTFDLADGTGTPPLNNVFSNDQGTTIRPALVDGSIIIDTFAPDILSKLNNTGLPGKVFRVIGKNFDKAGLSVKVCGVAAQFQATDSQNINVTAPACGATGAAVLEVCTNFGCDSDPQGFIYDEVPLPTITNILSNSGVAGKIFFVSGTNFDKPGMSVKVCDATAVFSVLNAGSLQVTAPACGTLGFAKIEVCNANGCASRDQGFNYSEVTPGTPFVRGDANASGDVDLTDGIVILEDQFIGKTATAPCRDALDVNDSGDIDISDPIYLLTALFVGGDPIRPPYPAAGLDPTADGLPGC